MDYHAFIFVDESDEDVMSTNAGLGLAVPNDGNDGSQLSDAPFDLMEFDETFHNPRFPSRSQVNVLQPRRRHAGLSRGFVEDDEVKPDDEDHVMGDELQSQEFDFDETEIDSIDGTGAGRTRAATIEAMSTEILQIVVSYLNDQDLNALALSSPRVLAVRLLPENAGQWKERFLSLYDEPVLEGPYEYCLAYRHRRYVMRKFMGCGGGDQKALEGMQVIRDMIIETYYQSKAWLLTPSHSRNLAAFSAYSTSPWMMHFLSTSFYGIPKSRCKKSTFSNNQDPFDALQLVLSHLVLNVNSMYAIDIPTSREDYDIEKIYLWKKPFETFYRLAPEADQPRSQPASPGPMFPNLTPPPRPAPESVMHLDLHGLLHIRNFWRRHLTEADSGLGPYAGMAQVLKKYGKTPKKWDKPLTTPLELSTHWAGHYSCIHNVKNKADLLERQTCALDWVHHVDPLTLDIASTQNASAGYWPPIFSTIPAFAKSVPPFSPSTSTTATSTSTTSTTYIAGLAPFLDPSTLSPSHSFSPHTHTQRHHPFLSLRVRGLVHAIDPQPAQPSATHSSSADDNDDNEPIPGWHRIAMVLYLPHIRYLVQVYENACEDYGDPSQQTISGGMVADGAVNANSSTNNNNNTVAAAAMAATTFDPATGATVGFDHQEYERRLRLYLEGQLEGYPGPVRVDRAVVEQWEDEFLGADVGSLSWDDIEYAYAYEGIVVPGGKIMMGRWWRCAEAGFGEGRELVEGGGEDRGPWLFWADD